MPTRFWRSSSGEAPPADDGARGQEDPAFCDAQDEAGGDEDPARGRGEGADPPGWEEGAVTDPTLKRLISDAEQAVDDYAPRCWIVHRYSRWEDKETGIITNGTQFVAGRELPKKVASYIIQERRCLRCNKVLRRAVRTDPR
jgi:hypothetical protein